MVLNVGYIGANAVISALYLITNSNIVRKQNDRNGRR